MLLASVAVGPHLSPKCRGTDLAGQCRVYASMAIQSIAFLANAVNRKVVSMAVQRASAVPSVTQKGNGLSACGLQSITLVSHVYHGSDMKLI